MKKSKMLIFFTVFSILLGMFFCPSTVYAFSNPFDSGDGSPSDIESKYWIENLSYTLDRTQLTNKYLVDQIKNMQQRRNFYGGLVSVGSGSAVGNGFKNTIASNNSNSFNKMYLYNNQTTNNKTEYFSPMYVSNSGNTTNNYHWYNPMTTNYEVHNDWTYSPTYNTFNYTTNNYNYYVTNNNTYISYVIMPTPENTADDAESLYFEIYFELPDGRDSYDLTAKDVWGTYFCYNALNYDYVAEDDGTTLGLWHLNNNLKDSSYWANSTGKAYSSTYKDGGLSTGKFLGTSTSDYFTLPLDKVSFSPSSAWTLEWLEYTPSYNSGVINYSKGNHSWNNKTGFYECDSTQETLAGLSACGIGNTSVAWDGRFDDFAHYALVFNGSTYSIYINGVKDNVFSHSPAYSGIFLSSSELKFFVSQFKKDSSDWVDSSEYIREQHTVWDKDPVTGYETGYHYEYKNVTLKNHITQTNYLIANRNSIIDEVRLSKGAIYTSDFEPPAQEFVTNMVFVLPESAQEGDLAVQSQYTVNGFRVGGVKPTYPSDGFVYVYEENDKVKSVQQYQGNGWYEVGASVYSDGGWKTADGFDLSAFKLSGDVKGGDSTAPTLKITRQPKDKKAHYGDTVDFSIEVSGDGLTYQWQRSADGENWENIGQGNKISYEVSGSSANLFDSTLQTSTANGIAITNNKDGTYTLNGTSTAETRFNFPLVDNTFAGNKFIGCPSGSTSDSYFISGCYYDENNTYIKDSYDFGKGFTIGDYPKIRLVLVIQKDTTLNNVVIKPMITANLDATYSDFVPYSKDGFDYSNGKFRCVVKDSSGLVVFSDAVTITIVPDDEEIPPEENDPTDETGETDESKDPDGKGDNTDYSGLFSGIKKIFSVFTGLIKTVIDGISSLLSTALNFISSLSEITGQFGDFLNAMFPFIPKEIFAVITLGITVIITVAVIKFIRG